MTQEHPITPPPELVQEWVNGHYGGKVHRDLGGVERTLATQAARWGADQELEACILLMLEKGWMNQSFADNLRAARRPKPLSLKEQAVFAAAVLRSPDETCSIAEIEQHWHTICNALEQLND